MANELTKHYMADGQEITLNPAIVARFVTGRNITEMEAAKFISLCAARGLNPFTGDVYFTPNGSIIVGKDVFTKRAQSNPKFKGMQAGVTVWRGGQLEQRVGSLVGTNENLVGGWAKVFVEGYVVPVESQVSLSEYSSGKGNWTKMPATMIRKVALVQALREAFPKDFQGLYDSTEMATTDASSDAPAPDYELPAQVTVQEENPVSDGLSAAPDAAYTTDGYLVEVAQ